MEQTDAHLLNVLTVSLSCSAGGKSFAKLWQTFGSFDGILLAEPLRIAESIGTRVREYAALTERRQQITQKAEEVLGFCKKHRVGLLPYDSPLYPESLRNIEDPPALLYYRGQLPDFNHPFYAGVVGTRNMSAYGRDMTFSVAHDLTKAGAVIVSGMALGIDGAAHTGAISAGGITVAVIGSGIDVCYPKQHLTLARNIVSHGCIMTEYPPGSPPSRYHFPSRNRLISGLSHAVLVMEGGEKSGALFTARYAQQQGKPVYALPGNINRPGSILPGILLRNGAKPFLRSDDIIRDFQTVIPGVLNPFRLEERDRTISAQKELEKYGAYARSASVLGDEEEAVVVAPKPERKRKTGAKKTHKTATAATEVDATPEMSERRLNFTEEEIEKEKEKAALAKEAELAKLSVCGEYAAQIYAGIPTAESIAVEALVTEQIPLRILMKTLLKMEIHSLIVMLPGERVRRA